HFVSKTDIYREDVHYCEKEAECLFRVVLMEEMEKAKISILKPRKDQCDVCILHKVENLSDEEYNKHQKQKDETRESKQKEKEKEINNLKEIELIVVVAIPSVTGKCYLQWEILQLHLWFNALALKPRRINASRINDARQIKDLRLFTNELNKYANERLGTNLPTDDLTDEQNPYNTMTEHTKTTQKTTRQESTEIDGVNTENRFAILQKKNMQADYTAERTPKEKRTRIPPIILKNIERWTTLSSELKRLNFNFVKAKNLNSRGLQKTHPPSR
ncbi:hypothetical protein ILUMI_10568, partial [Ignelater luminosus]